MPASAFPAEAHYVALGHLHRRQTLPAPCPVVYSGAPFAVEMPALRGFNFTGGATISPEYGALTLGLVVYSASYIAEIVRSGILAVPTGQWEAAGAIGLRPGTVLRKIVLPQGIKRIIPVLASTWVSLFKGTSLVSTIGVADLAYVAMDLRGRSFRVLEVLTALAVIYWVLGYPQAKLVDWLHRKYGYRE